MGVAQVARDSHVRLYCGRGKLMDALHHTLDNIFALSKKVYCVYSIASALVYGIATGKLFDIVCNTLFLLTMMCPLSRGLDILYPYAF